MDGRGGREGQRGKLRRSCRGGVAQEEQGGQLRRSFGGGELGRSCGGGGAQEEHHPGATQEELWRGRGSGGASPG